jgi:hypothetical protein
MAKATLKNIKTLQILNTDFLWAEKLKNAKN